VISEDIGHLDTAVPKQKKRKNVGINFHRERGDAVIKIRYGIWPRRMLIELLYYLDLKRLWAYEARCTIWQLTSIPEYLLRFFFTWINFFIWILLIFSVLFPLVFSLKHVENNTSPTFSTRLPLDPYFILSRVGVTINGFWIGWLDLLHLYTCNYINTALSLIFTFYNLLLHPLMSSACYSPTRRFLAANFNTGTITVTLNYTL
jgi:hypothetical protein